jgi:hypothetical protein
MFQRETLKLVLWSLCELSDCYSSLRPGIFKKSVSTSTVIWHRKHRKEKLYALNSEGWNRRDENGPKIWSVIFKRRDFWEGNLEHTIKRNLKETGFMLWIVGYLVALGCDLLASFCEHGDKHSEYTETEFLVQLSDYEVVKKQPTTWSYLIGCKDNIAPVGTGTVPWRTNSVSSGIRTTAGCTVKPWSCYISTSPDHTSRATTDATQL